MFIRFLILFITVPIVEVYILLQSSHLIGLGPTIALVLLTGVAGAYLARTQGTETVRKIQLALSQGEMPTEELLDGAMILAGGLTLLTPGFCTDLAGFCLLVPVTRNAIKRWVRLWLEKAMVQGNLRIYRG